jgi:hypothetical protein
LNDVATETTILGAEGKAAETTTATTDATQKTAGDTSTEASPKAGEQKKEEGKQTDDKAKAEEGKVTEAKAKEGDQADLAFKLPDGMKADEALLKDFGAIAKEAGLKGEAAQKVVDLYVKAQEAQLKRESEAWSKQTNGWREATKADKEIGGAKLEANAKVAMQAVAKFGTPELKQLFEEYGIGNHPELVRFCVRVGKALAEDSVAGTTATGGNGVSAEEAILRQRYPTMFPKEQ